MEFVELNAVNETNEINGFERRLSERASGPAHSTPSFLFELLFLMGNSKKWRELTGNGPKKNEWMNEMNGFISSRKEKTIRNLKILIFNGGREVVWVCCLIGLRRLWACRPGAAAKEEQTKPNKPPMKPMKWKNKKCFEWNWVELKGLICEWNEGINESISLNGINLLDGMEGNCAINSGMKWSGKESTCLTGSRMPQRKKSLMKLSVLWWKNKYMKLKLNLLWSSVAFFLTCCWLWLGTSPLRRRTPFHFSLRNSISSPLPWSLFAPAKAATHSINFIPSTIMNFLFNKDNWGLGCLPAMAVPANNQPFRLHWTKFKWKRKRAKRGGRPTQSISSISFFNLIHWLLKKWIKLYYNSKVAYYIHGQYDLLMEEGNWRNQINQLNLNGGGNAARHQQIQFQFNSSLPNGKNWLKWIAAADAAWERTKRNLNSKNSMELNEGWMDWWLSSLLVGLAARLWAVAPPALREEKANAKRKKANKFNSTKNEKGSEVNQWNEENSINQLMNGVKLIVEWMNANGIDERNGGAPRQSGRNQSWEREENLFSLIDWLLLSLGCLPAHGAWPLLSKRLIFLDSRSLVMGAAAPRNQTNSTLFSFY